MTLSHETITVTIPMILTLHRAEKVQSQTIVWRQTTEKLLNDSVYDGNTSNIGESLTMIGSS